MLPVDALLTRLAVLEMHIAKARLSLSEQELHLQALHSLEDSSNQPLRSLRAGVALLNALQQTVEVLELRRVDLLSEMRAQGLDVWVTS